MGGERFEDSQRPDGKRRTMTLKGSEIVAIPPWASKQRGRVSRVIHSNSQ
jgi:hypothetical protein